MTFKVNKGYTIVLEKPVPNKPGRWTALGVAGSKSYVVWTQQERGGRWGMQYEYHDGYYTTVQEDALREYISRNF